MKPLSQCSDQELKLIYDNFSNHAAFCRESLIVETEDKRIVPMILSPGQVRLREAIRRQRERQRPVRIIYLKSRRIQATTGTAAEFFRETAFRAGVHTVVLGHDAKSTENIFGIYRRFHENYRPFAGRIVLPNPSKKHPAPLSDRVYYEYGGDPESSFIQVHTAGSTNFGRSFRVTNVHFSEFPYYDNPGAILSSVMSAVPKLPDTCAVIEGTAKTIADKFHKMWQDAIDPSSDSEWIGVFMGWWEHPANRMPPAIAIEQFANSITREERELMERYRLDLQQLCWRRWTIANDFSGDLASFKREHPATPEEAFSANSRNRFSVPNIQRMPIQRDPMVGELAIEDVGIEKRIVFHPNPQTGGALRVWRRPEKGRLYAVGADCAQGIDVGEGQGSSDPDYSVAQVFDRDTGEQAAVLRARMMPGETGRYIAALGRWYNMAQICGERNPGGGGISMLEAIINSDYPSGLLYHRSVTPDQEPQVRGDRLGWDTSGVSRPQLLSMLDEAIRLDALHVHCHITQSELLTFIIKPTGKAEAQAGCHDDCVIALALVMVVCERMPRPLRLPDGAARPEVTRYGRGPQGDGRGTIVRRR
ncbi:MAG TPA: hypothetical protein VG273_16430 [Bryobacteraceae bacterium]|jgi:hypothetical protein|nr:hypothetical protein [Bryobacteraceae bacterium]